MSDETTRETSGRREVPARHTQTGSAVFSAARVAEIMAVRPAQAIVPTPDQTRVIEQPLGGSVLVIAGAGSGKTETMANRVVWLVANGLVRPSQILGLTFTRKAAGELSERVIERLQLFSRRLASAMEEGQLRASEVQRAHELHALMSEGLDLPEVSTYNAFASAVVQEFGAYAGVASGGTVIDEATAWGVARDVVCQSNEPALVESRDSIGVIVRQLMTLDHAVSDNLTSFDAVVAETERVDQLGSLPYNDKKSEGRYAKIDTVLENMAKTRLAVRLARRFSDEKRRRGLIEFSDQLALAVETLRRSPEAARVLRQRTPVVLLDEVQDTSVGQTALLSMLFRGSSVMAVGDPHQSIYGFRGASASNLQTFHRDFGVADAGSGPGAGQPDGREAAPPPSGRVAPVTLTLSTSWRNPGAVLDAANCVSAPLAARLEAETRGLTVPPLNSRAEYLGVPESTSVPPLEVLVEETIDDEFAALAEWMRAARNEHLTRKNELPTAAVVCRSRTHMQALSEALWEAGVPSRIVGLGGLLTTPEVTDLVSALRCLWYADAGNDLLRLLAGPRFRIGVSDLAGLADAARWFSLRDHEKQPLSDDELRATSSLTDPEREYTLLDALDEIAGMSNLDHRALRGVSAQGRVRLREAGSVLRSLRGEVGGDIPALLRSVSHALQLDIELDANELSGYEGGAVARANLDAFTELVEGFLGYDEEGTLSSVLAWLERAREDDQAAEHVPEPEPGTVQLITVHGSKGLEWDLVAIPRLVRDEFPSAARDGMGWLRPGQLPDSLRGDAGARPKLELSLVDTQKAATDAITRYQDALKDRQAEEERRLAYVAMTRSASRLLLTCSFWGGQTKPREPAVYLQELETAGLIAALPAQSAHEQDPAERAGRTLEWPLEPLGRRRESVLAAADALRDAIASGRAPEAPLHPVVRLLLAERETEHESPTRRAQPVERLTASTFHEFIDHPIEAEQRRLRPLPVRPYRRTRTGNLFHEWVERRASTTKGTTLQLAGLEELEGAIAGEAGALSGQEPHEDLQQLVQQFERSRWADRQPIAVELEITMPFAGRTLVCKLDAVYQDGKGEDSRFEIVDWKSGRAPRTAAERASRFLQLDLYRHAYAQWADIDPNRIEVTLFYVAEGQELSAESGRSLAELEALWLDSVKSLPR